MVYKPPASYVDFEEKKNNSIAIGDIHFPRKWKQGFIASKDLGKTFTERLTYTQRYYRPDVIE